MLWGTGISESSCLALGLPSSFAFQNVTPSSMLLVIDVYF